MKSNDPGTALSAGALAAGAVLLLWALALWHSLIGRGLFIDGSAELLYMIEQGGYVLFYDSRQTVMAVTQTPAALALRAGVTDTHLLAQLLSAGLFAVPTALYHASLWRARRDPALLGAVLCPVAVVLLPTSFFIAGEYNTISAAALFTVIVLATGARANVIDGLVLSATALLLLRSYETMLVYGPLLALLIGWHLVRRGGSTAGRLLHALAALLFVAAAWFSWRSLIGPHVPGHVENTLEGVWLFATNLQFFLPLLALLLVALGGLARPGLLERRGLYLAASVLLLAVMLTPLLWLGQGDMRPYPKAHYHSRMAAGVVVAAIAVSIALYALPVRRFAVFAALATPAGGRRLMLFGAAAVLAALPADLTLSVFWQRSLVLFQDTIAARGGLIPAEETPFGGEPWRHLVENWALASESLVLRRAPTDGIILPPHGFTGWQFIDATRPLPPGLAPYLWK
ncbi:MAG: hypothetical protein JOY81_13800 [Alphaproteobacteria bacterium]|nr:hypothetical protein [Alphaproteobacteria bacterium]